MDRDRNARFWSWFYGNSGKHADPIILPPQGKPRGGNRTVVVRETTHIVTEPRHKPVTVHSPFGHAERGVTVAVVKPGNYSDARAVHQRGLIINGEGQSGRRLGIIRCESQPHRGWPATRYEYRGGLIVCFLIDVPNRRILMMEETPRRGVTVTQTVTRTRW